MSWLAPTLAKERAQRCGQRLALGRGDFDHAAHGAALERDDVDDQGGAFAAWIVVLFDFGRELKDALADRWIGLDVATTLDDQRGAHLAVAVQQRHTVIA